MSIKYRIVQKGNSFKPEYNKDGEWKTHRFPSAGSSYGIRLPLTWGNKKWAESTIIRWKEAAAQLKSIEEMKKRRDEWEDLPEIYHNR